MSQFPASPDWLTAGLVNLLSDEELTAMLAHEACHCRQRDPLRLLISRALKSADTVGELNFTGIASVKVEN